MCSQAAVWELPAPTLLLKGDRRSRCLPVLARKHVPANDDRLLMTELSRVKLTIISAAGALASAQQQSLDPPQRDDCDASKAVVVARGLA
jgi:hypothetical protein